MAFVPRLETLLLKWVLVSVAGSWLHWGNVLTNSSNLPEHLLFQSNGRVGDPWVRVAPALAVLVHALSRLPSGGQFILTCHPGLKRALIFPVCLGILVFCNHRKGHVLTILLRKYCNRPESQHGR